MATGIQNVSFNPADPNSLDLMKALQKLEFQKQMAQKMMDQGDQMPSSEDMIPAGGQYVPAQIVRHSPFEYAARGLSTALGGYNMKKVMEKQGELQGQAMMRNYQFLKSALSGDSGGPAQGQPPAAPAQTSGAGGFPVDMQTPQGVDYAQMMQESHGDPNALGPMRHGEQAAGRWQIEPSTARDPGFGIKPLQGWDGKDPRTAPQAEQDRFHGDYMNMLRTRYGDQDLALMGYNAGPGRMDKVLAGKQGLPAETAAYAPAINARMGQGQPQGAPQAHGNPSGIFGPRVDPAKLLALKYADPSGDMAKYYMEAGAMTPEEKNAMSSGAANPMDYEGGKAGAVAAAQSPFNTLQDYNKARIAQGMPPVSALPGAGGGQGQPMQPPGAAPDAMGGAPGPDMGGGMPPQQPGGLKTPAQLAGEAAEATKGGENAAEIEKVMGVMQGNLPIALQRFNTMRAAAKDASYGGADEDSTLLHMKEGFANTFGTKSATANNTLHQMAAQGILPELGPSLSQAGIKGNKFLETIANNASGLNMAAPPADKVNLINGLEKQYISNMKATAAQLRAHGRPAPSDAEIDNAVGQYRSQYGIEDPFAAAGGAGVPQGWTVKRVGG